MKTSLGVVKHMGMVYMNNCKTNWTRTMNSPSSATEIVLLRTHHPHTLTDFLKRQKKEQDTRPPPAKKDPKSNHDIWVCVPRTLFICGKTCNLQRDPKHQIDGDLHIVS